jgi:hypothetical protein
MHKKEKGTGVRTNPGRQTDLFRKMSNAKAPGEGGRARGGGAKEVPSNNTGMIIAIAAAAIVVIGGVAFAVLHKSEPEHPKTASSKDKESGSSASKKKKKEDAPPKPAYTPPPPTDSGVFKPGARALVDKSTTPMMSINPETRAQFEAMVAARPADVVSEDYKWITYVIDGMLSDTESVAKGSMEAMHLIINKHKLQGQTELGKNQNIGGFNMPEMRQTEYSYWAGWWFVASNRNAVASWAESAGGTVGAGDAAAPRVVAANIGSGEWRDTLMKCRSGGFSNSSNPEYYEFQRIKAMGKSAYPILIGFIDDDELGSTAVLILKELSGRSDATSRVTPANKAKIKEDWEGWLRSGP